MAIKKYLMTSLHEGYVARLGLELVTPGSVMLLTELWSPAQINLLVPYFHLHGCFLLHSVNFRDHWLGMCDLRCFRHWLDFFPSDISRSKFIFLKKWFILK